MLPTTAPSRTLFDRLGIGVSVVCLVHCLAMPFLLTGLSFYAVTDAAHHAFHIAIAAVTVPLALAAAWPGYREHRRGAVPLLLGAGALLFVLNIALHDAAGEAGVLVLSVAGSLLLVAGHVVNYRARPRCAHHGLPHHAAHHAG